MTVLFHPHINKEGSDLQPTDKSASPNQMTTLSTYHLIDHPKIRDLCWEASASFSDFCDVWHPFPLYATPSYCMVANQIVLKRAFTITNSQPVFLEGFWGGSHFVLAQH